MGDMIKRVELRASKSAVEIEILKVLYEYEELVLKKRNKGRNVRAIYTWRMFDKHGIIKAVERLMRTKKRQSGLSGLTEMGLQDLTFEAVVMRHPESFAKDVVQRAKERLQE
jgi:hypothetical protein